MTKQFTAVLTLKLVESGLLDLDGTVATYLPGYQGAGAPTMTIHHLLSNTSGIPHHYVGVPDYLGGQDQAPQCTGTLPSAHVTRHVGSFGRGPVTDVCER